MIRISEGKVYLRATANRMFAVFGVVAVPQEFEAERLYPALVGDEQGVVLPPHSRAWTGWVGGSISEALIAPLFHKGAIPDALEVLVRDTELPDAPAGQKWVLIAGPSMQHTGESRVLTITRGTVAVTHGEQFVGEAPSDILRNPIWGPQHNPCALAHTMNLVVADEEIARDREANMRRDPSFKRFCEIVDQDPVFRKSWHTAEECARVEALSSKAMKAVLAEEDANQPAMRC